MDIFSEDNDTPFKTNLVSRHKRGKFWRFGYAASTVFAIVVLVILLLNILNSVFGYAAVENKIDPERLAINDCSIDVLHKDDLVYLLEQNVSRGVFRKLANEKPFEERNRKEVYDR